MKPVVRSQLATADARSAIAYYANEVGTDIAQRFLASLAACYAAIAEAPGIGSAPVGYDLGIPGLRARRIPSFPFLAFYMEQDEQIVIWRLLHEKRDFASWLVEGG